MQIRREGLCYLFCKNALANYGFYNALFYLLGPYNDNWFRTGFYFKIIFFSDKLLVDELLLTVTLQLVIIYMPFFNEIFKTQPLTFNELLLTLAVSSIILGAG
ncbi:cation transporting ATPase C-terminal domain-containing protein [Flavobacterium sp. DSP2-3-1]|uniref:cation transporting ATPase C-terminal domain-containing protein n=1 Tax=Flavobacterium sp. DSP2-3-1 TaxID=2804620 RepID=UPI003CF95DFA